jgi:hypothetical protein
MRTLFRLIPVLTAAAVGALAVTPAATARAGSGPPKGMLTGVEYRQLSAEQAAFKRLEHDKRATWNEVYAACRKVGQSTALLRSVRANCDTGLGIDRSLAGFFTDAERCAALSTSTTTTSTTTTTTPTGTTTTGTVTTGTTTTGTTGTSTTGTGTTTTGSSGALLTPAELTLFACLQPEYAVIGRAAESVYRAQSGLRSQVLARDFVGRCRLTLAPTTRQLRVLDRFVAASRQLAADVALITKVATNQAPESVLNGDQIKSDSVAFNTAGRAFSRLHRPQRLSVCPRA